MLKMGGQKGR